MGHVKVTLMGCFDVFRKNVFQVSPSRKFNARLGTGFEVEHPDRGLLLPA
jgi:hypothetical protein